MDPLNRTSLSEQAVEAIKRQILTRHLQAGARLPSERQLCESLGISRSILREALSILVAQGIVEKVPGKGAFVADFNRRSVDVHILLEITDESRLRALYDLRIMLELGALQLVAQRGTSAELDQLEDIVEELEHGLSAGEWVGDLDTRFHLSLFSAAHSPALLQLYKQILMDVTDAQTYHNPERRATLTAQAGMANISLLRSVIDALRDGDVCSAQRSMMAHISM
jgi:GntR family transcriptional repressor for pyruvate dehydrogenase complex